MAQRGTASADERDPFQSPTIGSNGINRSSDRIGDIEVLRAFAILLVLYEHADLNLVFWHSSLLHGAMQYLRGWVGVDLFFAISGFVIARSLLPQLRSCLSNDEFILRTAQFWIRRAWRLLPSAWLWLLIPLILCITFNRSGIFMTFRADIDGLVAAMLNLANFHLGMTYGKSPIGISFIYWSLFLEEQFYLVLPIAIFLLRDRIWMVLGPIIALQFLIPPTTLTVCLRGGSISLGVLVAVWQGHSSYRLFEPRPLANHRLIRTAIVGLSLAFIAMLGSYTASIVQFPFGMVAVLSAVLVWLASYDENYVWHDSLLKRAFLWIGARSYALYLIHQPVYLSLHEIWFRTHPITVHPRGLQALAYILIAYVLLLGLADLNYRLLEVPLRRRGAAIAMRFGS